MTVISSGGFLPSNNLSNILINNSQIMIISLLMLVSFFSIFLTYNLIFTKNHNLNFFNEDIHLLFYFLTLLFIFFIFLNFDNNPSELFLSLTSSVSNIGFSLDNNSNHLSFIFLLLVMIGGSFFSTSSGIRFLKVYSLFKYSINEILSYSRPKNIYINKHLFSKEFFKLNSFKLSILTLMNTVNSSIYGLADFSFNDLHFFTKYFLIFFMIIGRLELLTLLIICKKFLFKS